MSELAKVAGETGIYADSPIRPTKIEIRCEGPKPNGTRGTHKKMLPRGTTIPQARRERAKMQLELDKADAVAPNRLTLSSVGKEWLESLEGRVLAGELSRSSLEAYGQRWRHIDTALGSKAIQRVSAGDMARVFAELGRLGLSGNARTDITKVAGRVFSFAVTRGLIQQSPLLRLAKSEFPKAGNVREPQTISYEKFWALLEAAPDKTFETAFLTQRTIGTRASELVALTWGDIDRDAGTISIEAQLSKSGERVSRLKTRSSKRTIPLTAELDKALMTLKALAFERRRAGQDDLIFQTEDGKAITGREYAHVFARAVKKAGLSDIRPHDLRRTAISSWIAAGVDMATVSRWSGDSIETVFAYYAKEHEAAQRASEMRAKLEAASAGIAGGVS